MATFQPHPTRLFAVSTFTWERSKGERSNQGKAVGFSSYFVNNPGEEIERWTIKGHK